jgi:hypothetical protein
MLVFGSAFIKDMMEQELIVIYLYTRYFGRIFVELNLLF